MILRVKTADDVFLNIRHGAPSAGARVVGKLKANDTRKVTDIVKGDELEGNKVWYQHEDDTYTWSGGYHAPGAASVTVTPQTYLEKKAAFLADKNMAKYHNNTPNEDEWKVSWAHVDMEICRIWEDFKTQGEGVRVAIIDSGVHDTNNDLKGRIAKKQSFTGNNDIQDISPYHGTKSAGIIGANGNNVNTVYGVAPKCELYVYKAATEAFTPTSVSKALDQAIKDNIKIVCMCLDFNRDDNTLKAFINECINKNIIPICSVGNVPTGDKYFPSSYPGCISIGGYFLGDKSERKIDIRCNYNNALTLLGPSNNVLTTAIDNKRGVYDFSSAACAFTAGIMALIVAKHPTLNSSILLAKLSQATESIEKTIPRSDKEGFGILNINKLMKIL